MSTIFCPNCGEKHTTNNKFCETCGADLGEAILRYKQRHLPITYQQGITPQPNLQETTNGLVKKPRKKAFTITSILVLIFLILTISFLVFAYNMDYYETWTFITAAVFGSLFVISLIIRSAIRPRRGVGTCSGSSSSSSCDCGGSDCSGCDGCDCSGCDCGGFDC